NHTAALAHLPLDAGPRAADLALEPVARGRSAPLVALDLALEAAAGAVLADEPGDRRDEVVAGHEARPDRHEHGALGVQLNLLSGVLRLRGGRPRAARAA